jgi:pimeloyl-ACP methyl ester carboxylesterase
MTDSYADAAHYRLAPAGCREVVVLLHGLGGDLDQLWDVTDANVGGRPVAKLAPDARAHGRTELGGDGEAGEAGEAGELTFALLARDVLGLVDRLGLGPQMVLVGVSMGAATALALALGAPERVHGLVLARPAWRHEPLPPNLAVFAEIAALLRSAGPGEGRSLFSEAPSYRQIRDLSPSVAASLLDQFDKPFALSRVRRLEELPRSVPYRDPAALRAVAAPALVVGAPRDPVHPLAFAEELAGLLPEGRLAVITARDVSPERNRADLASTVDAFLAGLEPIGEGCAHR